MDNTTNKTNYSHNFKSERAAKMAYTKQEKVYEAARNTVNQIRHDRPDGPMASSLGPQTPHLSFKYCECGCHGYSAECGGFLGYWIIKTRNRFQLHRGHGWMDPMMGNFNSYEEAAKMAAEDAFREVQRILTALGMSPLD